MGSTSSGPAPFKPPSAGATSDVVEASGTAKPGEIVSTSDRNTTVNTNSVGRPLPTRAWENSYGTSNYGGRCFLCSLRRLSEHDLKALDHTVASLFLCLWTYNKMVFSGYNSGMYNSGYGSGMYNSYGGGGYGGMSGGMYGSSMYRGGYGSGLYGGGSGMYGGGMYNSGYGGAMGGYGMGMGGPYGPQNPNNQPPSPPGFWISFLRVVSINIIQY